MVESECVGSEIAVVTVLDVVGSANGEKYRPRRAVLQLVGCGYLIELPPGDCRGLLGLDEVKRSVIVWAICLVALACL